MVPLHIVKGQKKKITTNSNKKTTTKNNKITRLFITLEIDASSVSVKVAKSSEGMFEERNEINHFADMD